MISGSVKHVSLLCWTSFLNNILFGLYEKCDNGRFAQCPNNPFKEEMDLFS